MHVSALRTHACLTKVMCKNAGVSSVMLAAFKRADQLQDQACPVKGQAKPCVQSGHGKQMPECRSGLVSRCMHS